MRVPGVLDRVAEIHSCLLKLHHLDGGGGMPLVPLDPPEGKILVRNVLTSSTGSAVRFTIPFASPREGAVVVPAGDVIEALLRLDRLLTSADPYHFHYLQTLYNGYILEAVLCAWWTERPDNAAPFTVVTGHSLDAGVLNLLTSAATSALYARGEEPSADATTSILAPEEVRLLKALKERYPASVLQCELAADDELALSRGTIGSRLNHLRKLGLTHQPSPRKGDAITSKGLRVLWQITNHGQRPWY
jgi:hypothetical protein